MPGLNIWNKMEDIQTNANASFFEKHKKITKKLFIRFIVFNLEHKY